MAVQVERPCEFMAKGLDFGGLTLCPAEGSNSYILLAIYFQPISLGSQQSMATQFYGLSTWTAGHSVKWPLSIVVTGTWKSIEPPASPRPAPSCPGGREGGVSASSTPEAFLLQCALILPPLLVLLEGHILHHQGIEPTNLQTAHPGSFGVHVFYAARGCGCGRTHNNKKKVYVAVTWFASHAPPDFYDLGLHN
jgi:hypothetical protein